MASSKKDKKQGLLEVRSFTGKQKPWDSFHTEGKELVTKVDHEGNMPIHLAMYKCNWQIAQYVLDKNPKYADPEDPKADEVER